MSLKSSSVQCSQVNNQENCTSVTKPTLWARIYPSIRRGEKISEKLATPVTRSLGFIYSCTVAHMFRTRLCIIMFIFTQGTDHMGPRVTFMLEGYQEENLRHRSRTQIANKMSLQLSDHKRVVVAGLIIILAPWLGLCGIFLILAIAVDV